MLKLSWPILKHSQKVCLEEEQRGTFRPNFENWTYKVLINLLKPTGYVIHHQFNIQQLYDLPTLYLCVLYLSEKKQRLVPLTA